MGSVCDLSLCVLYFDKQLIAYVYIHNEIQVVKCHGCGQAS